MKSNHPYSEIPPHIEEALVKLMSLRDGDRGVVEVFRCGTRAVPYLRNLLSERDPSGIYEPRRRVVDALAGLGAYDVLLDYLEHPLEFSDPVAKAGEDAVINAAAEAVAACRSEAVFLVLTQLGRDRSLPGVIRALGQFGRIEALPLFIKALKEDGARIAAEVGIRKLGPRVVAQLLEAAKKNLPPNERESERSVRGRRSALRLISELGGLLPAKERCSLLELIEDPDIRVATAACGICLSAGRESEKQTACRRLISILSDADVLTRGEIEEQLVRHFRHARRLLLENMPQGDWPDESREGRLKRFLTRIIVRAIEQHGAVLCEADRAG